MGREQRDAVVGEEDVRAAVSAWPSQLPLARRLRAPTSTAAVREVNHWERFYREKRDSFFKHRYNLRAEFPELMPEAVRADPYAHIPPHVPRRRVASADWQAPLPQSTFVLAEAAAAALRVAECGCGVGNALVPLLRAQPSAYFFAFDFAPAAVRLLLQHPEMDEARVYAYVSDITAEEEEEDKTINSTGAYRPPPLPCHYVTCVWTLSAVPATHLSLVAQRLARMLLPGGSVLLRDYAVGDLAQLRHPACARVPGTAHEYLRGDGTRVHYFTADELQALFEGAGLHTEYVRLQHRVVVNRKERLSMHRRWVAAKFTRPE